MKAKCELCGNINEVQISSGHKKPENKGKKYFVCTSCGAFAWVEDKDIIGEIRESLSEEKSNGNGMLMCNAMNNSIQLACAGKIELDQIEIYYKKIMKAFEN